MGWNGTEWDGMEWDGVDEAEDPDEIGRSGRGEKRSDKYPEQNHDASF
jgi:hypothetical protein